MKISWLFLLLGLLLGEGLAAKEVLPPSMAGRWYPAEVQALQSLLTGMLAEAHPLVPAVGAPIRALLAPHAGYPFSGATAAAGFKLVQGQHYNRVVMLGPGHRLHAAGLHVPAATHLATPLGDIPVDGPAMAGLVQSPLVIQSSPAFQGEHSLEMELPFLQLTLDPGWQVVPILLGPMEPELLAQAAEVVRPLLDEHTLLVISGDFTHYGPHHGYQPFPHNGQTADRLRELDMGAWQQVVARDAEGLVAYRQRTGITACAFEPLLMLLHLLGPDSQPQLAGYQTSGNLAKDFTNSVSYLAAVVRDARPLNQAAELGELSQDHLRLLLKLARQAITQGVVQNNPNVDAEALATAMNLPEPLRRKAGAFVTLKKKGALRGCIGNIQGLDPLYRSVVRNALNAALRDARFKPVQAAELPELDLEVSVLSPLRTVEDAQGFQVGRHGVVLTKNRRQAVFLPEVAIEQQWDREQTLSQLSRKAGLPPDAWRTDAVFQVFTSQNLTAAWLE